MDVPIACCLDEGAARSQLGEWHDLLAASVTAADRVSPTELSLRLGDAGPGSTDGVTAPLEKIVRLAQREKACCPFFDFAIRIEADSLSLRVTVPQDAASILDAFVGQGAPPATG